MDRKVKMNGRQVKIWLVEQNIMQKDLRKEIGVGKGMFSMFVNGKRTSQPLTDFLIAKGCPEEYFDNGRVKIA